MTASCGRDCFLQQGQDSWLELMGRQMEVNRSNSERKCVEGRIRLETNLKVKS